MSQFTTLRTHLLQVTRCESSITTRPRNGCRSAARARPAGSRVTTSPRWTPSTSSPGTTARCRATPPSIYWVAGLMEAFWWGRARVVPARGRSRSVTTVGCITIASTKMRRVWWVHVTSCIISFILVLLLWLGWYTTTFVSMPFDRTLPPSRVPFPQISHCPTTSSSAFLSSFSLGLLALLVICSKGHEGG